MLPSWLALGLVRCGREPSRRQCPVASTRGGIRRLGPWLVAHMADGAEELDRVTDSGNQGSALRTGISLGQVAC